MKKLLKIDKITYFALLRFTSLTSIWAYLLRKKGHYFAKN